MPAHQFDVDRHADPHEEQRQEEAAERLDVGFELVAEIRFGQHHAGQEGAERHRHADRVHQRGGAEHDQERARRHGLAGAGCGEQAEHGVEQPASGSDDRRDGERDLGGRDGGLAQPGGGAAARRQKGKERQERHHRHVLEQKDREGRAGRRPAATRHDRRGCAVRSPSTTWRARGRRRRRRAQEDSPLVVASTAMTAGRRGELVRRLVRRSRGACRADATVSSSSPMMNRSSTTPSSATVRIVSGALTTPMPNGPITMPAAM